MDDTARLRVPPHSVEAEQNLLGGLLLDNAKLDVAMERVARTDFYSQDHGLIYDAIQGLVLHGKPADVITVFEVLQQRERDEQVGGLVYLNQLAQCVPSGSNVAAYADIVRRRSVRRQLIGLCDRLASAAFLGGPEDDELRRLMDAAAQEIADLAAGREGNGPTLMAKLLPGWVDDLSAKAEGKTDAISLGLHGVDRALAGGARRGDLIVLGARPSMGKSAFTLGVVRKVAGTGPVLVCSLEDSASMLISRHVASAGRTPLEHVRVPQHAPDSMWHAVTEAIELLQHLPVYIDDSAGLSLAQVEGRAKRVKREAGDLVLVVVDYLQLMEDEGETRSNELARIARGLKNMAKRLKCVVLLLSQLSREADKTAAPPRLDHLAESGAIEQSADIIGLLWREARRNPKPDNKHKAQVEFAKNKNGATDTVQLWFDGATQRFGDMAEGGSH
jgi:replicative DNA helicase